MYLIDTHAHLYLPDFDAGRDELMEEAKTAGVEKILLPAIDLKTHLPMLETEERYGQCLAMMGLHPCSVNEGVQEELQVVQTWLQRRRFVAVGETGLDFYWDKTHAEQQYAAFERQIKWALDYALPVVIHSRNATAECMETVKKFPGLTGVFHCFSGTAEQAKEIIDLGFMLGIGGVVTFKNAGLDKVVGETDMQHIILETDAPYLAPAPYRGKRNESRYLKTIADKVASVKGISVEKVATVTTQNAVRLFKLS